MSSLLLTPFTARDGENLALYEWHTDTWDPESGYPDLPPRGMVLIVHGLGEHAERYTHVADQLLEWGFAVRAYDQRGHGRSSGKRGCLPHENALVDDLAEVIEDTRLHCKATLAQGHVVLPLVVLGHSLGGLVAGALVAAQKGLVDGLVLSSPALDADMGLAHKLLLPLMLRLAPNLCVGNGLDTRWLSHDNRVVRRYCADRQVHDRISPRLGSFIQKAGPATLSAAPLWRTPTLLMYAGADKLVNPAGSLRFARMADESPAASGSVTSKRFDGYYHELFNEIGADGVFDTLNTWLDARF